MQPQLIPPDLNSIFANQAQFAEQASQAAKQVEIIKQQQAEQQKLVSTAVPVLTKPEQNRLNQANQIPPADPSQPIQGDIKQLYQAIEVDKVKALQIDFANAFNQRIEFEQQKSDCNPKLIERLNLAQKEFKSEPVGRAFAALNINSDFINRAVAKHTRFNSYAFSRVVEIARAASGIRPHNAVTKCFLKSLFAFQAANLPFTQQAQLASLSTAIRVPPSINQHLTRHSLSKATAASQRSQMLVALQALDLLVTNGLKNEQQAITLKDAPLARALKAMLA